MIDTQKPKQLLHLRPINHTPQGGGHPIRGGGRPMKDHKFFRIPFIRHPPPPKKRKPKKK